MSREPMDPTGPPIQDEGRPEMIGQRQAMAPVDVLLDRDHVIEMAEPSPTSISTTLRNRSGLMDPLGEDEPPTSEQPPMVSSAAEGLIGDDVGDGYLRLVMHLEDGELSLTGARVIDGSLLQLEPTGDLFYQVLLDGRRIGLGGLPDLQLARGFGGTADGVATDETVEHTFLPLGSAEFVARIPRQEVTESDLDRLEVELLRPSETAASPRPDQTIQAEAASNGRGEVALVAQMVGLDFSTVPDDETAGVRRRLR